LISEKEWWIDVEVVAVVLCIVSNLESAAKLKGEVWTDLDFVLLIKLKI
jgi:hypothetical protein